MKLYLAGPMRGYDQYNFPAFIEAASALRMFGDHEVWSPAERDMKEDGFDPEKDRPKSMSHYMEHDLPAVCRAEGVALLPGWEQSQGACLEVVVALSLNKSVYAYYGERGYELTRLHPLSTWAIAMDNLTGQQVGREGLCSCAACVEARTTA
jgi:hypothetical protein